MGHPEKGCIVAPGVAEFHAPCAAGQRYYCAESGAGDPVRSSGRQRQRGSGRRAGADCPGPEVVLVKHLARAGLSMDRFEMLLVTAEEAAY